MKGVSPVVATILMIAIAIAAAVIAYSWLTSWQQAQQTKLTEVSQFTSLRLEGIETNWSNTSNELNIWVSHLGQDITLTGTPQVFVLDGSTIVCTGTGSEVTFNGTETKKLIINMDDGCSFDQGKKYTVKVLIGTASGLGEFELNT